MSSILKALKKVEHDKNAHSNEPGGKNRDILRDPPLRRSIIKSALPVIILSMIGTAITYILLTHFYKPVPQAVVVAAAPAAGQPDTVTAAAPKGVISAAAPYINSTSAHVPVQKALQLPVTSQKPTATQNKPPVSAAEFSRLKHPGTTPKNAITRKPATQKPAESLTVNGIALSDGETRQAVVNGMTVSKGSYIGGARVEDILQNRVRFRRGGTTFDVTVGNTGP